MLRVFSPTLRSQLISQMTESQADNNWTGISNIANAASITYLAASQVAMLALQPPPQASDSCFRTDLGYPFYFISGDPTNLTNWSTIGYRAPFTGAGQRTQANKNTDSVSVLDFYANGVSGVMVDPTGVVDSTLGIQAALNASSYVFFPQGTYSFGPVTCSIANAYIYGNNTKVIKRSAGALFSVNAAGVTISGLQIYGAQLAGDLIAVSAANVSVMNCLLQEAGSSSIEIHGIQTFNAKNLTVQNCIIYGGARVENADDFTVNCCNIYPAITPGEGSGVGVWAVTSPGQHSNNFKFTNNYVEVASSGYGVVPLSRNGANPPVGLVITGNTFVTNFNCYGGISIDTCGGGTVSDNTFSVNAGIPSDGAIEVVASTNIAVTGNAFDGGGNAVNLIEINASSNCNVVDNVLSNPGLRAVWMIAPNSGNITDKNIVSNNRIILSVSGSYGVVVTTNNATANNNNSIFSGNSISSSTTSNNAFFIDNSVSGTIQNHYLIGNLVNGCATGVHLCGTSGLTIQNNTINGATTPVATIAPNTAPNINNNSWQYGAAAPATGSHFVNERFLQSTPTVGQPKAWVCTVAGTPGTWVSEGNL